MGKSVTFLLICLLSVSALDQVTLTRLQSVKAKLPYEFGLLCDACKLAVEGIQNVWFNADILQDAVIDIIVWVCELKNIPAAECANLIPSFAEVVIPAVGGKYLDPEFVCSKFSICSTPVYVLQNITQLVQNIMADMPQIQPLPKPGTNMVRFLHVSDIHLDLDYQPGSDMNCEYESCCRFDLGTTNLTSSMAGYWGSPSNCDVPVRTVEAFLMQAAEMDIDFVLWTGDNPSSDYWLYNRETHLENAQVLTDLFKYYFPDIPVYPIMGNHACYPLDQFHIGNEQWLTEGLADMWSSWLSPEAYNTFVDNAYWSMKDNRTGLRILGLNTEMCDSLNIWLVLNDTDPGNHLEWLRQELYQAEANGEYVLIIGHIPIGDKFCSSTWATIYRAIVNRFRNIIRGQFFGHTHQDLFQLVESLSPNEPPAGVIYAVSSFTTFTGHAPSFRVFEMDTETLQLVNYQNYRLNITAANLNDTHYPSFDFGYDPLSAYGLSDLTPASWQDLSTQLQASNQSLLTTYWENMNSWVNGPGVCDGNCYIELCQKQLWCGTQTCVFDEFVACAGMPSADQMFAYLEELAGPWEILIP